MQNSSKKNAVQNLTQQLINKKSPSLKHAKQMYSLQQSEVEPVYKIKISQSLVGSKNIKNKRVREKQNSSFWAQQLKRIMQNNKITINVCENSHKQDYAQLRKYDFRQLQNGLVRKSVFDHYREITKKKGDEEESILREYKLQQQSQMRFKLDSKSKIKTRKNIYQKQDKQNQRSHSLSLPQHLSHQLANTSILKQIKQNPQSRLSEKFGCRRQKWKLTDFFNSIVTEQEKDDELVEKHRFKIELVKQLSKLEKMCEQIEENENQRHLIETFSKFSEKVSDKLCKKQRRLSRIKFSIVNALP